MDDLSFIRDVIDTFVHAVYVYDNKLLITFNYSGDNTVEIPLSEIEKSVDSAGSQVFDFYGINSTTRFKAEHGKLFFVSDRLFGICVYAN